jgi:predicted DNA-binding transcriptional regulator AlpA
MQFGDHALARRYEGLQLLNGPEPEVLTFNALLTILGRRSRQSIYDLLRRDPSFPKPRQIGGEFSIGWLRGEVMEWLNARPKAELNGLDAVERRRRIRHARVPDSTRESPDRLG